MRLGGVCLWMLADSVCLQTHPGGVCLQTCLGGVYVSTVFIFGHVQAVFVSPDILIPHEEYLTRAKFQFLRWSGFGDT